jgi:hypothetical protein
MVIEWSLDRIKYHTKKLWGFETVGSFQPRLRENIYLAPTLGRETKMFLDSGVGALPKVLEAYMGEATWPAEPT